MPSLTFLGTGTSHGVPEIACSCDVCISSNPKNRRLRCSAFLQQDGRNLLIDCSKDFREQALVHKIDNITDILITHAHADHVFGLDELRVYNRLHKDSISLYMSQECDTSLRTLFTYIYAQPLQNGGGVSSLENHVVQPGIDFQASGFNIVPIPVMHGKLPIYGYRIGDLAYITDCSYISDESFELVRGVKVLVLGALRYQEHPTHFNLDQAVEAAKKIGANQTWFVHSAHNLEHDKVNSELPDNINLAYDGLCVRF
ncbi:MAG: MBL fold metallo-hydrolase [Spirochaetes bacterium]|jgi:phosphoribosyl 1,2-cyclic phosphate phosphodiesterase|nr:MBL fold metallo-hydrolase [Spirochaetota bacterium]